MEKYKLKLSCWNCRKLGNEVEIKKGITLKEFEEKFNFIWLDYCGAFSYYMKDLDILFAKNFDKMKLILTYNLFDPAKDDDSYYFTRVIDYVLSKTEDKNVRLINDITHRYKKQMYNLGFNIK